VLFVHWRVGLDEIALLPTGLPVETDAECVAELVIGQTLGNQIDHLSLPVGDQ
jgi:hypothetical protein